MLILSQYTILILYEYCDMRMACFLVLDHISSIQNSVTYTCVCILHTVCMAYSFCDYGIC